MKSEEVSRLFNEYERAGPWGNNATHSRKLAEKIFELDLKIVLPFYDTFMSVVNEEIDRNKLLLFNDIYGLADIAFKDLTTGVNNIIERKNRITEKNYVLQSDNYDLVYMGARQLLISIYNTSLDLLRNRLFIRDTFKTSSHFDENGFWVGEGGGASGILPICPATGRIGLAWRSANVSEGNCFGTIGGAIIKGKSPAESAFSSNALRAI